MPEQHGDERDSQERVHETERLIESALAGLDDLDDVAVAEHVARFENVHNTLTDALNRAEGLLSGTNDNGS